MECYTDSNVVKLAYEAASCNSKTTTLTRWSLNKLIAPIKTYIYKYTYSIKGLEQTLYSTDLF
jgi:hypothetical protein